MVWIQYTINHFLSYYAIIIFAHLFYSLFVFIYMLLWLKVALSIGCVYLWSHFTFKIITHVYGLQNNVLLCAYMLLNEQIATVFKVFITSNIKLCKASMLIKIAAIIEAFSIQIFLLNVFCQNNHGIQLSHPCTIGRALHNRFRGHELELSASDSPTKV